MKRTSDAIRSGTTIATWMTGQVATQPRVVGVASRATAIATP
jgi:hypothetical protein